MKKSLSISKFHYLRFQIFEVLSGPGLSRHAPGQRHRIHVGVEVEVGLVARPLGVEVDVEGGQGFSSQPVNI